MATVLERLNVAQAPEADALKKKIFKYLVTDKQNNYYLFTRFWN